MYLVFAGEDYYPRGGWCDFIDKHASLDDARDSIDVMSHKQYVKQFRISGRHYEWYQIVNARTLKMVVEDG